MRILNLGSLNIDKVYEVDHFVAAKETISAGACNIYPGGKGLNQSVAIARAGGDVSHAGAVGTDGGDLLALLKEEHIGLEFVKKTEGVSGSAIIQVAAGENAIIVFGGANKEITNEDVDQAMKSYGEGDCLLLQNETSCVSYAMHEAEKRGMMVAFNASPITPEIMNYPLDLVDLFFVNEIEARYLSDCDSTDYMTILERLHVRFSNADLVMTAGADGVYCQSGNEIIHIPANEVPVMDTTAAGDTFGGYFLACIGRGMDKEEALRTATLAAGLAIGKKGASSSIPYWQEVNNLVVNGN